MSYVNSEYRTLENPDVRAWDDFVAARGGHVLQSSAWGELKSRFGWSVLRLALARDDALVAGAQILFRRLPLGLRFAYIPRGPIADPNDHNTNAALFDALCDAAKSRGAFALKIESNWLDIPISKLQSLISNFQLLTSNSIQPRTTIHLDLTRDLDAILAQMKPKWRYNIRLAERKGVTVREGSVDDLATFYRLMQVTSARDQFAIHSTDYYRAAFELFTARDNARLFVAEYAREPLAMIFVTAFGGEAIYLYGASSNAHRERMPNHALHWAAIQWAKARGCARYDFWGVAAVADAIGGARHSSEGIADVPGLSEGISQPIESNSANASPLQHGLYQFKQGFGGQLVQYAGARDIVFSRWRYAVYNLALKMRRGGLT
jgi:peptidoglycan pentaglycine glycine transferase (the first glycine)